MSGRYAIYYVPDPESLIYRRAASILGYCAYKGRALPRPTLTGISEELLKAHTKSAARYGFHGTIVAPFYSAAPFEELRSAVAALAGASKRFPLGNLTFGAVEGTFAAITPQTPPEELADLEARFVVGMSPYRLPLEEADIARRGELPFRQAANLKKWGYHLVFEDFTFHLTITDSLPDTPRSFLAVLNGYLKSALAEPLVFDRLGLFYQPSATEAFTCKEVFYLPL